MEESIMWNLAGWRLTPYAGSIWIACLLGGALFLWQSRKMKAQTRIWTLALGVILGLLGARLFYVAARLELFLEIGLENFFVAADEDLRTWGSAKGAAFWGAVGGVSLAAWIAGRVTGERTASILDALAPSAALGIAISRFGEYSIGEGIGPEVSLERLQFFPLAVVNEWEEWHYALFLLEGVVGLIVFALLMTRGSRLKDGYRARMFLTLYASSQIVLEALRRDNFLRWLFVRVSQVTAAVVLLGLVIFGILRWARRPKTQRMAKGWLIGNAVLFAVMVPAIVLLEFAVDKSPTLSVGLAYLLEALCCVGMGITTWNIAMKN